MRWQGRAIRKGLLRTHFMLLYGLPLLHEMADWLLCDGNAEIGRETFFDAHVLALGFLFVQDGAIAF